MDDCLNILDTSLEAAPTDKRFVAWIRMQRLVEECNLAFNLDDPGSTASLADFQVQQTLRGYERQLEILKREFESTPGVVNGMSLSLTCFILDLTFLERFHVNQYSSQQSVHP